MRAEARLSLLILLNFILHIPLPAGCETEQEIGLPHAIDLALKQNREIRKTILTLESNGLAVERAGFEFMFNITPRLTAGLAGDNGSNSYGLDITKKSVFGTEARAGVLSAEDRFTGSPDIHRNSVLAEIRQPLLRRLGRLVNEEPIVLAANSQKTARRQFELQKTDMIVEVVSKHEELLLLQRQVEYEAKAIERLDRLNRLSQVRERQGRITRVDSLRSDLKLGNARLQLNNTAASLQSLQADYAELLGFHPATMFKALPAPLVTVDITNTEAAIEVALSNRLDYAQIIQDCEDAKRGIKIARRNMLPDLSMISSYERRGVGESASTAKLDENVWFVGLTLDSSLPMRNERLALSEALIRNQLLELRTDEVKSAISRKVQQEILAYQRAQKQIVFADRNHRVAMDRAKLARRLFEMHKGDSFSVTDAEDELAQAEIQLISVQSDAAASAYKLKRVLGTLIEYPADLKPVKEL